MLKILKNKIKQEIPDFVEINKIAAPLYKAMPYIKIRQRSLAPSVSR